MPRVHLLIAAYVVFCAAIVAATRAPATARTTDVVLIVLDTTRADRMSTYGHSRPTTPNITELARAGVRFDAHHSTSSWTRPGMATLLTGRYGRELGVYEERYDRLPDDATTLAEHLDRAGYTTLGLTSNPNINAVFGFDQGFDVWEDSSVVFRFMDAAPDQKLYSRSRAPLMEAKEVTERALALVDAHATGSQPVYLQVLYIDPHYPYDPPRASVEELGDGATAYEGEIRDADFWIGRLLEGLAERGIGENALFLVTSDHGEGLGSHPGVPHAAAHGYTLYDSVTHVPLVMRHPDLPVATEVAALSSHVDVLPTVLELLDLPSPTGPGTSLIPRIGGAPGPEAVFMETDWRYCEKSSVRTATHRYSENPDHARYAKGVWEGELDASDKAFLRIVPPEEAYDLDEVEHPRHSGNAEAEALAPLLEAWEARTTRRPPLGRDPEDRIHLADGTVVADPWAGEGAELDAETEAALEALGYLK